MSTPIRISLEDVQAKLRRSCMIDADRVEITRTADGDLVLHPVRGGRGKALLRALEGFDDDFVTALEERCADQLPLQDRDNL